MTNDNAANNAAIVFPNNPDHIFLKIKIERLYMSIAKEVLITKKENPVRNKELPPNKN